MASQNSSVEREVAAVLRDSFSELRPLYAQAKRELLSTAKRGPSALLTSYDNIWWQAVARPRFHILRNAALRAARQRAEAIQREALGQFRVLKLRHRMSPPGTIAERAVQAMLARPRGRQGWRIEDRWWPRDAWVKRVFFRTLQDFRRRADREAKVVSIHAAADLGELDGPLLELLAASGTSGFDAVKYKGKAGIRPKLAPKVAKIEYPFPSRKGGKGKRTLEELVDSVADQIVLARGEYFAAVGIKDSLRESGFAAARAAGRETSYIWGWRWELDPAHPVYDECDIFAQADVGHPAGPGVYFDGEAMVYSHPNCWCRLVPEWAPEDLLDDDGEFETPEPPRGYEKMLRQLEEDARDSARGRGRDRWTRKSHSH